MRNSQSSPVTSSWRLSSIVSSGLQVCNYNIFTKIGNFLSCLVILSSNFNVGFTLKYYLKMQLIYLTRSYIAILFLTANIKTACRLSVTLVCFLSMEWNSYHFNCRNKFSIAANSHRWDFQWTSCFYNLKG